MAKVTTGINGNNADMYRQKRGANGTFGSGKEMRPTAGGKNPLLYYDNGEQRRIRTQSGAAVNARRFDSAVNTAGRKAIRRGNY